VGPIGIVGWSAVGVVVVLWLAITFSSPSQRRMRLEWSAATALYVALSMLFLNLVLRAHADDSTLRLVAFGFLLMIFALGFAVSLVSTFRALRGSSRSDSSATN
jgi:hypothetical protein